MEMRCDGLEIGCEGSRFFLEVSFHRVMELRAVRFKS